MSLKPRPVDDGLLIIFEGIDGSGKTTQIKLAEDTLAAEGWPVRSTRVPGGTPIGEELRKVMLSPLERPAQTSLYIAVAIQEALFDTIDADRAKGEVILMHRGPLSMAAYELSGGELDVELGWRYVDTGMSRLRPELTIIYSTDVDAAMQRTRAKGNSIDYFESQPRNFFEKVADGYRMASERYSSICQIIDANQPIEVVQAETIRLIRRTLDQKMKRR